MFVWQLPAESQVNNNSTHNSLTEEQRAEAETLKSDGETKMAAPFCSDKPSSNTRTCVSSVACDTLCLISTGNDQMKVENFSAAVEFYSKAIAINPHNAVYYCNRSVRQPISIKLTETTET